MTTTDLPQPSGWRILLEIPEVEEKTKGGIILSAQTRDNEKILTFMGVVTLMGPLCYTRDDMAGVMVDIKNPRAPAEPWCKIGDTVLVSKYAGTKVIVRGKEYRLINDDEVQAVVPDPSIVKRG